MDKLRTKNINLDLINIAKKYKIDNFFIFLTKEALIAISPIAFNKARLTKILNSSSCAIISKRHWEKYKQIYLRITEYNSDKPILKKVSIFKFDRIKDYLYSRPHSEFLKSNGFHVDCNKIIGEKPLVYKTYFK